MVAVVAGLPFNELEMVRTDGAGTGTVPGAQPQRRGRTVMFGRARKGMVCARRSYKKHEKAMHMKRCDMLSERSDSQSERRGIDSSTRTLARKNVAGSRI